MDRLTEPRKHVLRLIAEYSYLSTEDCYRLIDNDSPSEDSHERKVRRLLHDFAKLGYLHSFALLDLKRSGRFSCYQNIYWFSSKGLELAQDGGLENGEGKANDDHSPRTLNHEYEITRFHLGLKIFATSHGLDLYWQQRDLKTTVNPDALFGLSQDGAFYYFLEIEKSKLGKYINGEPQILRKLVRYYEYYNSDDCETEWRDFRKFPGPRHRADRRTQAKPLEASRRVLQAPHVLDCDRARSLFLPHPERLRARDHVFAKLPVRDGLRTGVQGDGQRAVDARFDANFTGTRITVFPAKCQKLPDTNPVLTSPDTMVHCAGFPNVPQFAGGLCVAIAKWPTRPAISLFPPPRLVEKAGSAPHRAYQCPALRR